MMFLRCDRTRHNTSPKEHTGPFTDILRYIHRGSWVFVVVFMIIGLIFLMFHFSTITCIHHFLIFLVVKVYGDRVELTSDPVLCKVAMIKEFSHWTSRKRHVSFCLSSRTFASQSSFLCIRGLRFATDSKDSISPRPPHHPSKLRDVSVSEEETPQFWSRSEAGSCFWSTEMLRLAPLSCLKPLTDLTEPFALPAPHKTLFRELVYSFCSFGLLAPAPGEAASSPQPWDSGEPTPPLIPSPSQPVCPRVSSGRSLCPANLPFIVTLCGGRWPEPATCHPWFLRPKFHPLEFGSWGRGASYLVTIPVNSGRGGSWKAETATPREIENREKHEGEAMAMKRIGGELGRDTFMKENKHSVAGGERREV